MGELIVQPDAEFIVGTALSIKVSELLGRQVPAFIDLPNPRPAGQFIRVLRVGGSRRNVSTWVPTLAVESWGQRKSQAWELAQLVDSLMYWFTEIGGHAVYDVTEFAGPANLPDPLTDQARYTATYAVPIRAQQVLAL